MSNTGVKARRAAVARDEAIREANAHVRWALDNLTLDDEMRQQLAMKLVLAVFPDWEEPKP